MSYIFFAPIKALGEVGHEHLALLEVEHLKDLVEHLAVVDNALAVQFV